MNVGAGTTQGQVLRFLIVGGGFSLGYSLIVAVLIGPFGLRPYPTSLAVFALCVPLAFMAHRRFSFGSAQTRKAGVAIYAGSQILSFATVSAITTRFVTGHLMADMALYLITVAAAAVLTFTVAKFLVFRA